MKSPTKSESSTAMVSPSAVTGQPPSSPGTKEKALSRFEKEKLFVMKNVDQRLNDLVGERRFLLAKSRVFWFGLMTTVIGIILIMKGLQLTPLFANFAFDEISVIAGGVCCLPLLAWFLYVFALPLASGSVRQRREELRVKRKERRNPGLFNDMVRKASEDSKPPPVKIRVYIMFRKHEFSVVVHSVKELCEQIEYKTSLRPAQQLFKYNDEEIELPLDKVLEDLGITDGTALTLYNTGGYIVDVKHSPDHRMRIPREGDSDTDSVLDQSIANFRRDANAFDKLYDFDESAPSVTEVDDDSWLGYYKRIRAYFSPTVSRVAKDVNYTRKSGSTDEETKRSSGFGEYLASSKKVKPADE